MLEFANLRNAIQLITHQVIGDTIYIVMEKCERNLENYKMTEEDIREMLIQFKPVFTHLKNRKIIHRDIKPGNIFIKYDENKKPIYKIGDFGISKCVDIANSFCGAYGFMSPEIINRTSYSNKTDIYSLGATIYSLLFGEVPKIDEIVNKKLKFKPKNKVLKDLLCKMLAYKEKDRISWDELIKHRFLK